MQELRDLANRAVRALAETPDPARRKRAADYAIGWWLSAALDDREQVSSKFKHDINEWFAATEQLDTATKLARLLAIAQVILKPPSDEGEQPPAPTVDIEYSVGDLVTLNRFDGKKFHYMILRSGAVMVTPPPKRKPKSAKGYTQKAKRV
jgi:hypothetical protein